MKADFPSAHGYGQGRSFEFGNLCRLSGLFWFILPNQSQTLQIWQKKEEQFSDLSSLAPTYSSFKDLFIHEAFERAHNHNLHVIRTSD